MIAFEPRQNVPIFKLGMHFGLEGNVIQCANLGGGRTRFFKFLGVIGQLQKIIQDVRFRSGLSGFHSPLPLRHPWQMSRLRSRLHYGLGNPTSRSLGASPRDS